MCFQIFFQLTLFQRFYNKSGKTYLFDLDFYHLKKEYENKDGEEWTNKYTVDAYQAGNVSFIFKSYKYQ